MRKPRLLLRPGDEDGHAGAGRQLVPLQELLGEFGLGHELVAAGEGDGANSARSHPAVQENVPRLLENHLVVEREVQKTELSTVVRRTQLALANEMRPCRSIPEVTAWEATFQEMRFRYNFLVLDGPSKMGKTLFCRSRSLGRGVLLEIDCAGADTPDLSGYQFGKHTMILCDEGSAEMVLRYKKLFQASASFVTLGSSKTNCHAYDVWAHAVKFVVTSNRWKAELDKLPAADSRWLEDNSVYVYVDSPLWIAD